MRVRRLLQILVFDIRIHHPLAHLGLVEREVRIRLGGHLPRLVLLDEILTLLEAGLQHVSELRLRLRDVVLLE